MTIAEVGRRFDVSADTLRYYERIGLIPAVPRTAGGIRCYDEESLARVDFIKCMRSAGLSIETLQEYFTLFDEGDNTLEARKALLTEQHKQLTARIDELQATADRLAGKISHYEDWIVAKEHKMRKEVLV